MLDVKWLYEFILVIYCLSLLGYFIDFIQHNQKANKLAFWLLGVVWVIQSILLCIWIYTEKSFPIQSVNDSLFFYSWILVTFSLLMNRLITIHFITFFTNLFSFFILIFFIMTRAQNNMQYSGAQLVDEILIAHIILTIISYGFFTLSFLFSLMYLIQYRLLKEKKGLKWMWRFADLHQLNSFSFRAVTVGVPILLIGIILGFIWAYVSNEEFYFLDMKTIGSIFVLFVYTISLILQVLKGYQGKTVSIYNSAAFLLLLINFFLFSVLSNFHF